MNIVELKDISKVYRINKEIETEALNDINLTIKRGEFVSIVGPSGSGKSTLLHLIGGLEKQTGGVIKVNGKELLAMDEDELANYRRKEVGFVFQKYNLIPMLNAKENIELPLIIGNERVDKDYLEMLINFLGLEDRLYHLPGELSGGQQQRVSIARALITKPSLILADEPTGNLDQKSSEEIVAFLYDASQKFEQTVIMITHNMELAKQAQRIIHIVDGRVRKKE